MVLGGHFKVRRRLWSRATVSLSLSALGRQERTVKIACERRDGDGEADGLRDMVCLPFSSSESGGFHFVWS